MTDDLVQIWLVVFSLAAVVLVNQRRPDLRRWGPVCGLVSQPAWFYATLAAEQYGMFVLSVFYTWSWAHGVRVAWWPQ